jgi:hypothetical protein
MSDIIVPITLTEARKNISEMIGVPEDVIDIDIDYVTPIYTQFSLKNSEQISDIATNKDRVGEYFRFENKDIDEIEDD